MSYPQLVTFLCILPGQKYAFMLLYITRQHVLLLETITNE